MPPTDRQVNELVLSDGEYAYTQDTTKGVINVHTGPTLVNVGGQEYFVVYNATSRRFVKVDLDNAAQICPLAPQGSYIVLDNPAKDGGHPNDRSKQTGPELSVGQKVNIPGPRTFALWPRQVAQVIPGHTLRSNEYLLVRVYDEDAARKNWETAVVKPASSGDGAEDAVTPTGKVPKDLSVGRLIVIKGTEVSFYIPPTGISVVPDSGGRYVRDALTLERLEYCILVDENGNKRYERGPAVVFPEPTEAFFEDSNDNRVFRPVELNPIQGLHLKVIADYKDENGTEHKEGEELFLTGKDTPIYFPRPEHSLVTYDGRSKHFAVAIPAGEARYVMDRLRGPIKMVKGPAMLLPDPRSEIIVRRVLSDSQCRRWYPGNSVVIEYNQQLRELAAMAPTTRSGAVSEGEIVRSKKPAITRNATAMMDASPGLGQKTLQTGGQEFSHQSTFTQPRTITLDTKLQGVPTIDIWTGYAVMVISPTGDRRVELGPKTVLLDYDESLEVLTLSTGRPKNTDRLLETVYLRVRNNQVSDLVTAETADHVVVEIKLSIRVNFEGDDPSKWFEVENYVKILTDHIRSVLSGSVRKIKIDEFYARSEDLIRDIILGVKDSEKGCRPGMSFPENGMRVSDVEVLKVTIPDQEIAKMLASAQFRAVQANIQIATLRRDLDTTKQTEEVNRIRALVQAETAKQAADLKKEEICRTLQVQLAELSAQIETAEKRLLFQKETDAVDRAAFDAMMAKKKDEAETRFGIETKFQELKLDNLKAETDAVVSRFEAGGKGLSEALVTLQNQETVVKLAEALSVQTLIGGGDFVEVVTKIVGSPKVAEILAAIANKSSYR